MAEESDSDDEVLQFLERSSHPIDLDERADLDQLNGTAIAGDYYANIYISFDDRHGGYIDESEISLQADVVKELPKRQCRGLVAIERPIPYKSSISFSEARSKAMFKQIDWYFQILDRYLEAGYLAEALVRVFQFMPRELADAFKDGLRALEIIKSAIDDASPAELASDTSLPPIDLGAHLASTEDALWESRTDCGYLRLEWDPATQRRRRAVVNTAFAALNGLHPEEMVARIGNREAAFGRTNDIDFLCCLVHDVLAAAAARTERYGRVCDAHGRPFLARVVSVKDFDSAGRICQARRPPRTRVHGVHGARVSSTCTGYTCSIHGLDTRAPSMHSIHVLLHGDQSRSRRGGAVLVRGAALLNTHPQR
jgi:hypothetical protein